MNYNNKKNILALVAMAILLTGCMTKKYAQVPGFDKVHVPYVYKVKTLRDERVEQTRTLEDIVKEVHQVPFNQRQFMRLLTNNMNSHGMYAYKEAYLHIDLKDYVAIREGRKRTVSFYFDMWGEDRDGNRLAEGTYSCFQTTKDRFNLIGSMEEVFVYDDNMKQNQQNKIWQDLYKGCLMSVANEFNTHVLEARKSELHKIK